MSDATHNNVLYQPLSALDPEVATAMAGELARQRDTLEMIASENFVPRAVLQAQGSVLTNNTLKVTRDVGTTVAVKTWTLLRTWP